MENKTPSKDSPEKKLLEIIEQPQAEKPKQEEAVKTGAVKTLKTKKTGSGQVMLKDFLLKLEKAKKTVMTGTLPVSYLRGVNIVIILVCLSLVGYIFYYVFNNQKLLDTAFSFPEEDGVTDRRFFSFEQPGSDRYYLQGFLKKIERRNIFKPVAPEQKRVSESALAKQQELVKKMKLVGVSLATDPKDSVAMIEDTTTQLTHFLKTGQAIQGLTIATIQNDRVIFDFEGHRIDLR